MSACRSCGAEIVFGKSVVSGKSIPLDAEPIEGEVPPAAVLLTPEGLAWPRSRVLTEPNPPEGGTYHRAHFATCPQADDWRKR